MVPMVDIGLEVALEALEVAPVASPEELVLDVPEDSVAPLSMQLPLRDMLCTKPFSLSFET